MTTRFSRRDLIWSSTALALSTFAGCSSTPERIRTVQRAPEFTRVTGINPPSVMYSTISDEGFQIPAVPFERIDQRYYRQIVPNTTGEPPNTIIVDTANRFLYWTLPAGNAVRYGVGIGRQGFAWSGRAVVEWKQKWPKWFPPEEMIEREPELEKYSEENGGMEPGLDNPLGARALYIFQDGKDTLYRIHGSPEWASIGTAASSGCVRLMNQDIIDLYERVPEGSPILVV